MDLNERDPTITYKVTHYETPQLEYSIVRYPYYGSSSTTPALYRFDALPGWIQDGIRKLDLAGSGVLVPYFGLKRGDTYWFKSVKYARESGDGDKA